MATDDPSGQSASDLITERIASLDDWRGDALARVRGLIHEAVPDVVEEWKLRPRPSESTAQFDVDLVAGERDERLGE